MPPILHVCVFEICILSLYEKLIVEANSMWTLGLFVNQSVVQ